MLFPDPLGPMIATFEPGGNESETSRRSGVLSYANVTLRTAIPALRSGLRDPLYGSGSPRIMTSRSVAQYWLTAITSGIEAGVALVGAFRSASQVFRKGGIRIAVSNSHEDYFIKNLVAVRAELREALAVYRPAAFGEVTGLN